MQGALSDAIRTFIQVSPVLKDTIWSYLEQYDPPLIMGGPEVGNSTHAVPTQVYSWWLISSFEYIQ